MMINELQFGGTLLAPGTEMRPTLGEYCLTTVSIQVKCVLLKQDKPICIKCTLVFQKLVRGGAWEVG